MALLAKLKQMLSGQKKSAEEDYWNAWDKKVSDLEDRISVSQTVRLVTGGLQAFETGCAEILESLSMHQEGERKAMAERLIGRVELARAAARVIRDEGSPDRAKLWNEFFRILKAQRNLLHYKTRVKYDRLRLDHESGRYK